MPAFRHAPDLYLCGYLQDLEKAVFTGPIADPSLRQSVVGTGTCKPRLLVYGGSQGAAAINEKLRRSLPELLPIFDVFHICGQGKLNHGLNAINGYEQQEYVMAFSKVLQASDIAICRAGSGSLWELVLTGTPHLAIPLPASVSRGDQIENCKHFEKLGTTRWLDQDDYLTTPLAPTLQAVLDDRDSIRVAMQAIAPERPATETICRLLLR